MTSADKTDEVVARHSLLSVFGSAAAGILILFLCLAWLTYTSLLDFRDMFSEVADNALPDIMVSSQLYAQSSRLLESAERLSKSNSEAAQRLAEQQIRQALAQLKRISQQRFKNEYLNQNLEVIELEISEFSNLIKRKLALNQQLEEQENAIHKLHLVALVFEPQTSPGQQLTSDYFWSLQLSKTIARVTRSLNMERLQDVRSLFRQFNTDLDKLQEYASQGEFQEQKLKLTNNLAQLILQEDGLLPLKITQLRIEGRVIGRENFVHNLILDFARLLEFSANKTEQKIASQLASSQARTHTETTIIGFVLAIGVLFLLAIIMFIQKNVINRLRLLNSMVKNKIKGHEFSAHLSGNDEITDLANSFALFDKTIEEQKLKLEHMSLSDSLTGIANRRALDIRLLHDIELSIRKKSHVAILLMDIDCFKLYNDNYGHAAGDECLKVIAKGIKSALKRNSDFVARYGGEEFVCILPDTEMTGAIEIANDILSHIHNLRLPHQFSTVSQFITLSMGIAVSGPKLVLLPDKLLNRADKALYQAKDSGKNQFCIDNQDNA